MDCRKIIEEQIEQLQEMQLKIMKSSQPDATMACQTAETILLLCKESYRFPKIMAGKDQVL